MKQFRLPAVLLAAFVLLSVFVVIGWTQWVDWVATYNAIANRNQFLTSLAVNFTSLGSAPLCTVIALLAAALFVIAGRKTWVIALLWVPACSLLNGWMKLLVEHPRPSVALIPIPSSFGYPSGHVAAATSLYLTLALLAAQTQSQRGVRRMLIAAGIVLPVIVAWTRVYLGVHYFSDVVGGMLLGSAGALAVTALPWVAQRPDSTPPQR
jgi:undecaprenyl-diphosphatase